MSRNLLRAAGARARAVLALLLCGGVPSAAAALPLISEVLYDAVGSDNGQSFVELYGTPGMNLTGFFLEGINGSNGAVTHSIALSGPIPADGFFVLADDQGDGTTLVANADLIRDFDFQNGPDSSVSEDSATVQRRRMVFIGEGLREKSDSAEVHPNPPISNP